MADESTAVTPEEAMTPPASYKVIYVYTDTHPDHKGRVKVGDATLHTSNPVDKISPQEIYEAAKRRIDSYTKTADIVVNILHTELALRPVVTVNAKGEKTPTGTYETFRDYKVHEVLMRDGYKKTFSREDKRNGEWFVAPVEVVRSAISAVKAGDFYLSKTVSAVKLRPEQEKAVKQTLNCFQGATVEVPRRMLWNAKMRFGKTLTAYKLVKELAAKDESFKKVLIITHRPDVNDGWSEDFQKMGLAADGWVYGSKRNLMTWDDVKDKDKFVWFASIQDLRGLDRDAIDEVSFKKANEELFATEWSCIVNDEVHEGTLTELAKRMFAALKSKTYLDLSGTPFNIIAAEDWADEQIAERFSYDDRYNWSYPDERRTKKEWDELYSDKGPNPYADLPELRFVTYDISEGLSSLSDEEVTDGYGGVSFTELFKTSVGALGRKNFVHEEQVLDLLHKMRGLKRYSSDPALFPYHRNFENYFNHTLWMLPNVAACEAMKDLLKLHESGFAGYKVVNATGGGSESWESDKSALEAVRRAIASSENTITLSQQMLTTGVTVTPWTGVFMFNNTNSPMLYMQTAFRAASPGCLPDGRLKEYAYVFDFNPDRCLRQIVEVAKANAVRAEKDDPVQQASNDEASVKEYLEYMSLLTVEGAKFVEPDSNKIMEQLNEAYINEVVEKGFDSPRLWNSKQLQSFDIEKVKILEALRKLQGGKEHDSRNGLTAVSSLSDKERERLKEFKERADAEPLEPLTGEEVVEKKELEVKEAAEVKQERKNRQNAVSILAGVAARLPMLVYASPANTAITPENFAELIDDESWCEFMPKNLLRVMPEGTLPFEERQEEALGSEGNLLYWDDVRRFFDPVIFSLSCERIRRIAREIGEKPPLERAFRTACLFATFRNPDKETVLTPARVVELQYTSTLGGLSFLDLAASTASHVLARLRNVESGELENHGLKFALALLDAGTHKLAPVWVEPEGDKLRKFWRDPKTTVLDVNSKTALYPLFAAVSLFYQRCGASLDVLERLPQGSQEVLWKSIVEEQVFANCRVPYSARIARRVLAGYNDDIRVNTSVMDVIEVRRHLLSLLKGKDREKIDVLWKWLFDAGKFSTVGERVDLLMSADVKALQGLVKLAEEAESKKFSAVVSNPPYQMSSDKTLFTTAVYHHFMEVGQTISRFVSMIYPSRWTQSGIGEGIKDFKEKELASTHYVKYFDLSNSQNVFEGVEIAGGMNYFLWDKCKVEGNIEYYYDGAYGVKKTLSSSGQHIRDIRLVKVVEEKINTSNSLFNIVAPWGYYGTERADQIEELSKEVLKNEETLRMFYISKGLQSVFLKKSYTDKNLSDFKVGISKTANRVSGLAYPRADRIFLMHPGDACTISFMKVGSFDTKEEAINCLRYLKTDFANFLLGAITPAQNMYRKSYILLPNVNFSTGEILDKPGVFLDFSKPETLDEQLAEIYGLTEEERELMRKDLKPWKDKVDVEADR